MAPRDPRETLRRLLSLGEAITGVRREDVEEFVRDLVSFEGDRMERAEEVAEEVFARSRRSVERIGTLLRSELQRELDTRGLGQPGELVDRAVGLLGDLLGTRRPERDNGGRTATREDAVETSLHPLPATGREVVPAEPGEAERPAKTARPAKKAAPAKRTTKAARVAGARDSAASKSVSKAAAKKSAAKSTTTKKATAKKAAGSKAAAKKAAAKKTSGRTGPRRSGA